MVMLLWKHFINPLKVTVRIICIVEDVCLSLEIREIYGDFCIEMNRS